MRIQLTSLLIPSVLLAGCAMVGPNYRQPDAPALDVSDLLQDGAGESQAEITPETLADWWNAFDDPILTDLIERAAMQNLDVKAAQASVREARWNLVSSGASLYPFLDANGTVEKSEASSNAMMDMGESDFYRTGFDARWEIDVFGGTRRRVEAAAAALQSERENLKAVWVSLAGETAQAYIAVRTAQMRLQVAEASLQSQVETHQVLKSRFEAGLCDELVVSQASYNAERTRAAIPTIQSNLESQKNSLALLTGTMPGELHELLQETKSIPVSPFEVVVGIPADTLRNRPDIRVAERQLAAQTARIGEAEADLYPRFTLLGSIGLESLKADQFFGADSGVWSIGPSVSWPIFHAGSIRSNIEIQNARQEQLLARYEKAVLVAVKEVRDALVDYAREQERQDALAAAVDSAELAVKLAKDKYKSGLADFVNVLDAQRSLFSLRDELATSRGAISSNLVRLYKALGGGWSAMEPE